VRPAYSTLSEEERQLLLCEKMMRHDLFTLNWRGVIEHSYSVDMAKSISEISKDIHNRVWGSTSISGGVLTIPPSSGLSFPFYGPLPISGEPDAVQMELYVGWIGGNPANLTIGGLDSNGNQIPGTIINGSNFSQRTKCSYFTKCIRLEDYTDRPVVWALVQIQYRCIFSMRGKTICSSEQDPIYKKR